MAPDHYCPPTPVSLAAASRVRLPSYDVRKLSLDRARRVALAAQGLARSRPDTSPNLGHVRRAIQDLGLVQIDSVNVVQRAHHLTLFSRLGVHDADLVWRGLEEGRLFEYWARMASICPIEDYPLYRYRMERDAEGDWRKIRELNTRAPGYVEDVYRQVAERGPLTPADLDEPGERSGPWWGWADGKVALEWLFAAGRVAVAYRRNFTRYYDIAERVIPAPYLAAPEIPAHEATRALITKSAKALGVGTARDLVDYFSIRMAEGRPVLKDLVVDGTLQEVEVEGWSEPAFLHADARIPRRVEARSLLNPFDTYLWNRDRVERLHGFRYKIEIYVPAPKRIFGYYVLAFLLGHDLVARVDLKADRQAGVLRVPGAFLEDGADPTRVAAELLTELQELAEWLGMVEIQVGRRGDLAVPLRRAL